MSNRFLLCLAFLLTLTVSGSVTAQEKPPANAPEPPRHETGGERLMGTVASVGVDRFDLKKADGTTATVRVNDQTQYRQQEQEFHLEDLKPGDHVFVRGSLNSEKQFVAANVRRVTEEQFQRFQAGGGPGPGGGPGGPGAESRFAGSGDRAFGEIISIDQNQIKVRNRFQGEMTIVINDHTTFTKQGEAITLKDLKVGDRIFAVGKQVQGRECISPHMRSDPLAEDVLLVPGQGVLEAHAILIDNLGGLVEPVEKLAFADGIRQIPPRLFGRGRGRFLGQLEVVIAAMDES